MNTNKLFILSLIMLHLAVVSCRKDSTISPVSKQALISTNDNKRISSNIISETKPAVLTPIFKTVNNNIGGYYEALPARYDSTAIDYPLIIFIHGIGELGNGNSELKHMLRIGLPNILKHKKFPPEFLVKGLRQSFVILAPQFRRWPGADDVQSLISYATTNYRIDRSRIYMAGLSMGGGVTWDFAAKYGASIAAAVSVCGGLKPSQRVMDNIAAANLPIWAFHNDDDPTVPVAWTRTYVLGINSLSPAVQAKITTWTTGGHDSWSKAFDPTYRENNMDIYEWMLQYSRG